jgi:uncharacterized protein (TIGR03067 family)
MMKWQLFTLAAVCLMSGTDHHREEPQQADRVPIGEWKTVRLRESGVADVTLPDGWGEKLRSGGVVISADRFTFIPAGRPAKYRVYPATQPARIDIGVGRSTNRAIYRLEGDWLIICWSVFNGGPPRDFSCRAWDEVVLILRRKP